MPKLTRDGVERILGPIDNALLAEVASIGPSEDELREAYAWVMNDEALVNDFRPMPKGRVAELVELLGRQFGPDMDEEGY